MEVQQQNDPLWSVRPAFNPILIRHLLSHGVGFSEGFVEPESAIDKAYNLASVCGLAKINTDLEGYTHTLAKLPLRFEPRQGWILASL
jgi:hypothetical protein